MEKLNIGLCFLQVGDLYKHYTRESKKNKILYCQKHGYDFICDEENIEVPGKGIPWQKIRLIQNYLDKYDYIAYIDADMLINNDSIKIEHFIERYKDYDMFCGTDWIKKVRVV